MKRILLDGCPAQLDFEEPLSNKIKMIKCGNSKSFNNNTTLVLKTMNKEDQYSHLIPLDEIMCPFSPYCCHPKVWNGCQWGQQLAIGIACLTT
jgi:hypothetical protein